MPSPAWITLFLDVPAGRWAESLGFWASATGCGLSEARGEAGQFVTLLPASGDAWLKLQAVVETAPRMHLDLDCPDRDAAVEEGRLLGARDAWIQRLHTDAPRVGAHLDFATRDRPSEIRRHEQLGARRLDDYDRWTQMLAPSGHVYCVTDRRPETGRI